jgi:ABC-type glycerol-3-phosphate transport system substrate-binding protein
MNLSQPLDPYVNTNLIGNSPGVDLRTLEQTKWGGTYRCIAPIGAVDVIWYNESMVEQLGLKDPHTAWKNGKWNWEAWKEFLLLPLHLPFWALPNP